MVKLSANATMDGTAFVDTKRKIMANLIEGIQEQCNRVRKLVLLYEEIGPAGSFGAIMLKTVIEEGEEAIASGDVVRMVRAYKSLEECKE